MALDIKAAGEIYRRDGVVLLPRVLSPADLDAALAAYDWSLAHPGPGASKIRQKTDALFYQDLRKPGAT